MSVEVKTETEAEKIKANYDKLPFVGYFRVLRGSHNEDGRTYRGLRRDPKSDDPDARLLGEIVHSKSDLLELNPANAAMYARFEKVDTPLKEAESTKPKKAAITA